MKRYIVSLNQMPLLDELADIRDLDDDLITAIIKMPGPTRTTSNARPSRTT